MNQRNLSHQYAAPVTKADYAPPKMLLGAAVLFWGWWVDLVAVAVFIAVVLESNAVFKSRWCFTQKDFQRLADMSALLIIFTAVYLTTTSGVLGLYKLVQLLPLLILFLVGAQTYNEKQAIPITALLFSLRRMEKKLAQSYPQTIDFRYPYLLICLISASASSEIAAWFYPGACLITAWALWGVRSRRYGKVYWSALMMAVIILGFSQAQLLSRLQAWIQWSIEQWLQQSLWTARDPFHNTTAIGQIGTLKMSEQIIFRVSKGPLLLHEASYNVYEAGKWRTSDESFYPVAALPDKNNIWRLANNSESNNVVTVSAYFDNGEGLVIMPHGSSQIDNFPSVKMEVNQFAAVKVKQVPGMVQYRLHYGNVPLLQQPPVKEDYLLPKNSEVFLRRMAEELNLQQTTPKKSVQRLQRFFAEHFRYSLFQSEDLDRHRPLVDFLEKNRTGHCEYFATATALLLRAAGIPTRYATGYSVQEYSGWEESYVVRRRHAHAWTLAFIDSQWLVLDFTPNQWAQMEQQQAPWWLFLYDIYARIAYLINRWRWGQQELDFTPVYYMVLTLLCGVFLWRVVRRTAKSKKPNRSMAAKQRQHDSPFYEIIDRLQKYSGPPQPGEPLRHWLSRVNRGFDQKESELLFVALNLHYRLRFSPNGLTDGELKKLRQTVQCWLRRFYS